MTRPPGADVSGNAPWITLALIVLSVVVSAIAPEPSARFDLLVLDRAEPRPWPWLTTHFLHAGAVHLGWTVFALGCLGLLGEAQHRARFGMSLIAGIVAVDLWFACINVDLRFYCGLSGALNSVLLVTLYVLRGTIPTRWLWLAAVLVVLKVGWEWHTGVALLTHSRWPSAVGAHVAGLAGALPLLTAFIWRDAHARSTGIAP